MWTAKALIRLGGCQGWSESSLGLHSFCWFCHVAAQICYCYFVGKTTSPLFMSLGSSRVTKPVISTKENGIFVNSLHTNEPAHEYMVLFVHRKLILQTRMRSHPLGLFVWFFVSSFSSILHVCEQRRLWWDCADNLMSWLKWKQKIEFRIGLYSGSEYV